MTENEAQFAVVQYCHAVLPWPWTLFAVPNASRRTKGGKAGNGVPGLRPGASDLILIGPDFFMAIEMKRPASIKSKEGRLSEAQIVFQDDVRACGFKACVWHGIDDARNTFKALGIITREAKS